MTPRTVPFRGEDYRKAYRKANRPLAFLGLLATIAGLQFFADPSSIAKTAIGRQLTGPFDDLWSLFFFVGGILIVLGTQLPRPRLEKPGLLLFSGAVIVFMLGVISEVGVVFGLVPAGAALFVCVGRVRDLTIADKAAAENPTYLNPPPELDRRRR